MLHDASGTLRALRTGAAPFSAFTPAERAAQLASLLDDGSPDPATRREIEAYCDDVDRMTESRRGQLTAFTAA